MFCLTVVLFMVDLRQKVSGLCPGKQGEEEGVDCRQMAEGDKSQDGSVLHMVPG